MKQIFRKWSHHHLLWLILLALFAQANIASRALAAEAFDPPALYATWTKDPTTSITIIWHSVEENSWNNYAKDSKMQYRLRGNKNDKWEKITAKRSAFPYSDRIIHRADLENLKPDTEYSFRFNAESRIYYFRTMPAKLDKSIHFAAGGDTRSDEYFEKTGIEVMKHKPDFIMIGGDLAYENGSPKQVSKIFDWLDVAKRIFITEEGRVTPVIAAIGDHEVRGTTFERVEDEAPYYYAMWPFPGAPGYNVLDFGDYMSILVLHAGRRGPVAGAQTEWLEKTLKERNGIPHIFPIYHHGLYPSLAHRKGVKSQLKYWAPLFERYGVRVAFENHDHAYKRTVPIREGKRVKDGEGVVYLGDGSWGQLREGIATDRWYMAKALVSRSVIIGTIRSGQKGVDQQFKMYDPEGNMIDSYPEVK